MDSVKKSLYENILYFILIAVSCSVALYYLYFHFNLIHLPGAQIYQEGSFIINTDLLLKGGNPYILRYLPDYTEVYGPIYSIVVAPVAKLFGSSFLVHRATSAFFIFGSCMMLFVIIRLRGGSKIAGFIASALYYILFTSTYSTVSRPDSLGVFLMLISFFIAERSQYSNIGLALSIFFGILAYFTKPYFLFCIPCISVYLFLSKSKIKGLAYFISSISGLAIFILILDIWLPYFITTTLEIHRAFTTASSSWLVYQLKDFLLLHLGLLVIVIIEGIFLLINTMQKDRLNPLRFLTSKFNLIDLRQPLIYRRIDIIPINIIMALLILLLLLGWHVGAYLIYFIQLLSPFLIIWVLRQFKAKTWLSATSIICLIFNFAILGVNRPIIPKNYQSIYQGWENLFAGGQKIIAPPLLVHLNVKYGTPFYDNGLSGYFRRFILLNKDYNSDPVQEKVLQQISDFKEKVRNAYFDMILIEEHSANIYMPKCCISRKLMEEKYEFKGYRYLPCYYGNWKDRRQYGQGMFLIQIWDRKNLKT